MRLKHIKLVGFKSFVEPTLVPLPDNLVAIVGPNGCGKSNIIDAVRWVLGESSAKNLRGASMSDVIFNGSSQRKPMGQASVELLFDNNGGRLGGPFGRYAEIAVKRVVNRDGEAAYYLNNSRCRRRDITDLFLGTGAGARGYSIISQGTISQLIEARPEDLRVHLEEAAGIAKYKERRRETLSRISHTRDNLQRVSDICHELQTQLQRLERQAQAAERYRALNQQRQQQQLKVGTLQWQALEEERIIEQQKVEQAAEALYQHKAQRAHIRHEEQQLLSSINQKEQNQQTLQTQALQLATEIARLETHLQQQQEQQANREASQAQLQQDCQQTEAQLQTEKQQLHRSRQALQTLQKKQPALQANLERAQQYLQRISLEQAQAQQRRHAAEQELRHQQHQAELIDIRLHQLQEKRQQQLLQAERIHLPALATEINAVKTQLLTATQARAQSQQQAEQALAVLEQEQQNLKRQQQQWQQQRQQLAQLEKDYQKTLRAYTVQQTQIATLAGENGQHPQLLAWQKKQLALYTQCQVAPDWRAVVEWLFADALRGFLQSTPIQPPLQEAWLAGSGCSLFTEKPRPADVQENQLLAHIQGPLPHWPLPLEKIYIAENGQQGQLLLQSLAADASVLSRDGLWQGHGWLRIMPQHAQNTPSLLALQAQGATLAQQLAECEQQKIHIEQETETSLQRLDAQQRRLAVQQQNLLEQQNEAQQQQIHCQNLQKQRDKLLVQQAQQAQQQNDCLDELAQINEALLMGEQEQEQQKSACKRAEQHLHHCVSSEATPELLSQQQQKVAALQAEWHQTQLALQKEQQQTEQRTLAIEREQARHQTLLERLSALTRQNREAAPSLKDLPAQLKHLQAKQQETDQQLNAAKAELQAQQKQQAQLQANLLSCEQQAEDAGQRYQQHQLREQELAVRAHTLQEQLAAMGYDLAEAQKQLSEGDCVSACQQALAECEQKITRLGAINLAAIEEYQQEKERQSMLEREYADLTQALQTLESAIAQIDKESRQRLRETFDTVNSRFGEIFPKLFGGGHARLQLSEENLLEAGVLVMAQPPGKRNSTIHLLSGGEKAMTALALVFAIFQLNPSPFCMLDEVDAPLDEINTGRFCALVREMSPLIQFLFITHNKITMELAGQLVGVTMRESGVSRIVSVNVEEAAQFAQKQASSD
ncbi:MAG: chromosome segregation protein SMC [Legionellaceae bacterium]|nr:chromosome segregation protein SMC [Legionellaceae bacterium]